MVDSITGYFLACEMPSSLPLDSVLTVESVSWLLTIFLLSNCPGVYQDNKGNENPGHREAVGMSMSKQIKEVNKPDSHSLAINKKTEGEETDYLPRTRWNTN